jgi:hypothetical protein
VYRRQLFTACLTVKAPGIVSIKKICDGFEITVRDFFDSSLFDETEQGIK